MFYHIISDEYRIPVVEKAHVMMDTRLCCLEKAKDVTTSHVLSVTIAVKLHDKINGIARRMM